MRAIRFNLYRGGSATVGDIDASARRVHDVAGWHAEFYVDAADLADLEPALASLPQVSVDDFAMSDDTSGALLRLVESGMAVKATGFGRIRVGDPDALMRTIVGINPAALIFGSDLPSTRAPPPRSATPTSTALRPLAPAPSTSRPSSRTTPAPSTRVTGR